MVLGGPRLPRPMIIDRCGRTSRTSVLLNQRRCQRFLARLSTDDLTVTGPSSGPASSIGGSPRTAATLPCSAVDQNQVRMPFWP